MRDARDDVRGRRAVGPGYVPALDALRAIAVISVVLLHAGVPFLPGGGHGVHLFFALSGFLITTLLLREQHALGGIALGRFYGRRALRLMPALLVLCLVISVAAVAGRARFGAVAATLAYVSNWVSALGGAPLGSLAHTWSLGVEEQFYIVWPCVLIVVSRRFGARGVFGAAVIGASASLVVRLVLAHGGATGDRLLHGTDANADQLLWGCAVAAAAVVWPQRTRNLVRRAFVPAALFLAFVFVRDVPATGGLTYWHAAVAVTGATVVGRLGLTRDALTRGVSVAPLVWVGRISYGVYLWHFPLLYYMPDAVRGTPVVAALVTLPCSFAVAGASFYLVEQPLQRRFRERLVSAAPRGAESSGPAALGTAKRVPATRVLVAEEAEA
jgi:peptidoglycan/LPS O-acetylase OafA/YrhL